MTSRNGSHARKQPALAATGRAPTRGAEADHDGGTPTPLEAALAALDKLRGLPPDWDSYGALPVTKAAVRQARHLLLSLPERVLFSGSSGVTYPNVVPVPQGGVQLEWRAGERELEVEFDQTGRMSCTVTEPGSHGPQFTTIADANPKAVVDRLVRLLFDTRDA